jgi:Zn-dependent M28 family amino/carboxypeptidase
VAAAGVLLTRVEHSRATGSATTPSLASPVEVDAAALIADVKALSAPEMAGRRVGSPGGALARAFVRSRLETTLRPVNGSWEQSFDGTPRRRREGEAETLTGVNVTGEIVGTELPERIFVLSAHYDHLGIKDGKLYPGADDDASGVAALLAASAWFAAHPPRHTLLFVAFDAEELDLLGSKHFVANPPVPLDRVALDVNLDMISRSDRHEIYVSGTYHSPFLLPTAQDVARRHPLRVLFGHDRPRYLAGLTDDWTEQSDHGPFHAKGIPFLYFGVEDHDDYHQPTDTADKIEPAFLAATTGLVIDTLATLDQRWESLRSAPATAH